MTGAYRCRRHDALALRASAAADAPARTRWSARVVVDREGVVVGQRRARGAGGPHAEVHRARRRGRARARRDAVLHARAVLPYRAHRPVRAAVADAGIARSWSRVEDPNPLVNGRGLALCASAASRSTSACWRPKRARSNRPFLTMMTRRPAVRDPEGGAERSMARIAARAGQRTALTGAGANRRPRERAEVDAIAVGRGTCWSTIRCSRRAAPSATARCPRGVRPPAADAALGAAVLDARRPAGHNRDDAACRRASSTAGAALAACRRDDLTRRAGASTPRRRSSSWSAGGSSSADVEGGAALHARALGRRARRPRPDVRDAVPAGTGRPWSGCRGRSPGLGRSATSRPLGADVLVEAYVHGTRLKRSVRCAEIKPTPAGFRLRVTTRSRRSCARATAWP